MVFDPRWVEQVVVGRPAEPTEPLRAVFEVLGSRIAELEARARLAEERADQAEAGYSSVHHRLFETEKDVERLTRERDAAAPRVVVGGRSREELEKRIGDAVDVLVEHPRSGAKAVAILRGDEADPE